MEGNDEEEEEEKGGKREAVGEKEGELGLLGGGIASPRAWLRRPPGVLAGV